MAPRAARAGVLGFLTPAWCVLVVLSGQGTDAVLVAVEGLVGVAVGVLAATTKETRVRRTMALAAGWIGAASIGDLLWLVSSDTSAIGSFTGHQEPVSAVLCYLVHYVLIAVALLLATPRRTRPPGRWSGAGDVVGTVQLGASTAALIAVATPIGLLLDDGRTSSLFLVLDLVLAAAALGILARSGLRSPRPRRDEQRRVISTTTSVVLFSCADVGIELGLLRESQIATGLGFSAGLLGVAVLVRGHLWSRDRTTAAGDCLPGVPGNGRRSRLLLRLVTRHALPASVLGGRDGPHRRRPAGG